MAGRFDTVLCLNVLEYLDDPAPVIGLAARHAEGQGVLVVLVPNGPFLFGSLDRSLGINGATIRRKARRCWSRTDFRWKESISLNKAGAPPWWAYSRLFGSGKINKLVFKLFDKTVWLWSRIDCLMPWPGLSLIVVARKRGAASPPGAAAEQSENASPYRA